MFGLGNHFIGVAWTGFRLIGFGLSNLLGSLGLDAVDCFWAEHSIHLDPGSVNRVWFE